MGRRTSHPGFDSRQKPFSWLGQTVVMSPNDGASADGVCSCDAETVHRVGKLVCPKFCLHCNIQQVTFVIPRTFCNTP